MKTLQEAITEVTKDMQGCQDHFCYITGPGKGACTNGGCSCRDQQARAFRFLVQLLQRETNVTPPPAPPKPRIFKDYKPIKE